jgi:hypothetical protein
MGDGWGGQSPTQYRPDGGAAAVSGRRAGSTSRGEEQVALIFAGVGLWLAPHTGFAAWPALVGMAVAGTVMRRYGRCVPGIVALVVGAAAVIIGVRHGIIEFTRTPPPD